MRPPWSGLHHGVQSQIVCGRHYCAKCGRWRHICDFGCDTRNQSGLRSYCRPCDRTRKRLDAATLTPERRILRREYQRFWKEGYRRTNGIPVRAYKRHTVIDQIERVFLPREPFIVAIDQWLAGGVGDRTVRELAIRARTSERQINRIQTGESARIRIDLADRIALAVGIPLELLCPYTGRVAA